MVLRAHVGHLAGEGRVLKEQKIRVLKDQAADWDERSRSASLAGEIKAYLAGKSRRAYAEAEAIQKELDGPGA